MKEKTIQKYFEPIWEMCQGGINEIEKNRYDNNKMYLYFYMSKENIYGSAEYLHKLKPEIDILKIFRTRDLIIDTLETYYKKVRYTGQGE